VAQRVYATASDYYDFIGDDQPMTTPPDPEEGQEPQEPQSITEKDLNARLRRASSVIDSHTRHARYEVDDDGYPTDEGIADAFKEATCAQAQWFDESDDITGSLSQDGTISIGSVSIGARGRSTGGASAEARESRIAPEAVQILENAGLISSIIAHT
jgi:hypothetical protein